jgi:N-acyl-D-aspartate/D-glutamate deacylase
MLELDKPDARERLARGASTAKGGMAALARWGELRIVQTVASENHQMAGHAVGEVAAARGRSPFDMVLDITLADQLQTVFRSPPAGDDPATWELRSRYWGDPRTLIGGSDAGAHLDTLCNAGYTSDFLGKSVRDRGLLPLERAVHLITDVPARLFGLDGRGRIAPGYWADLVTFDPTNIGPDSLSVRTDLPGGASRLFCNAIGVRHVLVNGVQIVDGNEITGALPGAVLRSGRNVSTVTAR